MGDGGVRSQQLPRAIRAYLEVAATLHLKSQSLIDKDMEHVMNFDVALECTEWRFTLLTINY